MKKLLYLFLTVLVIGCSGDDNSNNGSNLSINGKWNFVSQTDCGEIYQYDDDCDLESYLLLDNGDGMSFDYDNDDENGTSIPCQIVNNEEFTYISVPNTNTYNFITDNGVSVGTVNGNTLSFITVYEASQTTCPQQEGTITEIIVYVKE
ncbi:hypothetical protein N8X76_02705 [Flavobacteriaceae bacterium]|nr:hypothetical protein [Flavobacteriaceae bacterium]